MQVNAEGFFRYAGTGWFSQALQMLVSSGVHGVAMDFWVSSGNLGYKEAQVYGLAPRRQHLSYCCCVAASQWGAVEKSPGQYNWAGYKQVLEVIKQTGLRVQVK